jgi:hypothetical protein
MYPPSSKSCADAARDAMSLLENGYDYILFIIKFPDPLQPAVTPVNIQVPEIVLFFTVPWSTNVLPLGVPD